MLRELDRELPGRLRYDHWEADLCGVGVGPVSDPSLLIYVGCWRKRAGEVCYSIEKDGDELEKVETATASELLVAILAHLTR